MVKLASEISKSNDRYEILALLYGVSASRFIMYVSFAKSGPWQPQQVRIHTQKYQQPNCRISNDLGMIHPVQ